MDCETASARVAPSGSSEGARIFGHGADLLLHAQQAALLRAHGGLALFVKRLGADTHHELLVALVLAAVLVLVLQVSA